MSNCKDKKPGIECCKQEILHEKPEEKLQEITEDYVICTCMEVMYSQIIEEINNGSDTFKKLSKSLGVGTGCSSCVDEIEEIVMKKSEINKKV